MILRGKRPQISGQKKKQNTSHPCFLLPSGCRADANAVIIVIFTGKETLLLHYKNTFKKWEWKERGESASDVSQVWADATHHPRLSSWPLSDFALLWMKSRPQISAAPTRPALRQRWGSHACGCWEVESQQRRFWNHFQPAKKRPGFRLWPKQKLQSAALSSYSSDIWAVFLL